MKNKLLNFTICQALIVIGMSLLCVRCQEQKLTTAENVTVYDRSFQRVLSRRKRFLLWRPGSNVLLTASLVKPLGFRRPTGHNLIIEWDIFYPLPTSWRVPKKPTPKPIVPPTPVPVEPVESWTAPKEVWQPESGWTDDVIAKINEENKKAEEEHNHRRNWNIKDRNWNEHQLFKSQASPPVSRKWNPLLFKRPWQPTLSNRRNLNFNSRYLQTSNQQQQRIPVRNFIVANAQQGRRGRSLEDEVDENWEYYHAHRDRRDLYERIENASPLNSKFVRNCLMRTMCEVQHFLHPPGYSLLHDMLRVIFTVPIKDDMNDDYSNAMRVNDQDCVELYSEKCPVSFLAILLHGKIG